MGTDPRAVLDDMKRRLERGPHAALGIVEGADAQAARAAFLQLTKTYHPAKFARAAPDLVRQANEVFLALRAAYESIAGPKRPSQPMAAMTPRMTPAGGVPILQRPPGGTPPGRESPTPAKRTASIRELPAQPTDRRDGTPVRGVPVPPPTNPSSGSQSGFKPVDKNSTSQIGLKADKGSQSGFSPNASAGSDKSDRTPIRGVPIPPSSSTPPAPRAAPLGVTIKGAPKPPATTANGTPGAMPQFQLPPGVEPGTEEAELELAMYHLRRKQWTDARKVLHTLAARNSKEKRYRALLSYARGREAQDGNRREDARTEFTRALQLDPDLSVAKAALAQVSDDESPPERPTGGLLSRLFKK